MVDSAVVEVMMVAKVPLPGVTAVVMRPHMEKAVVKERPALLIHLQWFVLRSVGEVGLEVSVVAASFAEVQAAAGLEVENKSSA